MKREFRFIYVHMHIRFRYLPLYMGQGITEAKYSEIVSWHQIRNEEKERGSQSYCVPRLKPGIQPALGQAPKKYATRFFQLKVGHGAVGVFLARIGAAETAEC